MKTILVAIGVLLASLALVPSASAVGEVCTLPPVSQFQVCAENGCAIVDGPALHREVCAGGLVGEIDVCTPGVSQFRACLGLPCSSVDGPAFHRDVCIPAAQAS